MRMRIVLLLAVFTVLMIAMSLPPTRAAAAWEAPIVGLLPSSVDKADYPEPITWGGVKMFFDEVLRWLCHHLD